VGRDNSNHARARVLRSTSLQRRAVSLESHKERVCRFAGTELGSGVQSFGYHFHILACSERIRFCTESLPVRAQDYSQFLV